MTIYTSQAAGGGILDTMMAVYPARALPRDETARKACFAVNDQSSSDVALTGDSDFSIAKNVVVGANSGVLVYVGAYYPITNVVDITSGPVRLNVLTP